MRRHISQHRLESQVFVPKKAVPYVLYMFSFPRRQHIYAKTGGVRLFLQCVVRFKGQGAAPHEGLVPHAVAQTSGGALVAQTHVIIAWHAYNAVFASIGCSSADCPETLLWAEGQKHDALPRKEQRTVCVDHDVAQLFENFQGDEPKGSRVKRAQRQFA